MRLVFDCCIWQENSTMDFRQEETFDHLRDQEDF